MTIEEVKQEAILGYSIKPIHTQTICNSITSLASSVSTFRLIRELFKKITFKFIFLNYLS